MVSTVCLDFLCTLCVVGDYMPNCAISVLFGHFSFQIIDNLSLNCLAIYCLAMITVLCEG